MKYNVIKSYQSDALKEKGILKDELIELSGAARNKYNSTPLRLIHFWDSTTGNEYHFLTNNTKWKASLVAS